MKVFVDCWTIRIFDTEMDACLDLSEARDLWQQLTAAIEKLEREESEKFDAA